VTELLYVALGDSTAVGIGARGGGGYPERLVRLLRPHHPSIRLVNLGESGATTSDLLARQFPRALRTRPALITVAAGVNDLGLQVPEEAFAANLEQIVIGLARLDARIAVANLPDMALSPAVRRLVAPAFYERRIQLYNKHVEATCARHDLALIDLWRVSRDALPEHPEYFSPDGFHPSADGYEVWAHAMAEQLSETLDGSRALPA
jgi:lysophospholipase L1-like esterase